MEPGLRLPSLVMRSRAWPLRKYGTLLAHEPVAPSLDSSDPLGHCGCFLERVPLRGDFSRRRALIPTIAKTRISGDVNRVSRKH